MDNKTKQQTVSNPIEHVVSSELVRAEYEGYRGYHTYAKLEDCPYTGNLQRAWLAGQVKAEKEDN
tara:strand:+ start:95 stop:289 length:195 start_codon:yes stop_codon:yes gene_type:complete